jgi:DNA-binding NtrC family response regulator
MTSERRTTPNMRSILLLAPEDVLSEARMELSDAGPLRVKAVSNVKEALNAIPSAQPHVLVIQVGLAGARQILTLRNVADLAASRKVPVVMFGQELPEDLDSRREKLHIHEVVPKPYRLGPVLEAIRAAMTYADKLRHTDEVRRKLARASQKLRPVQPPPEPPPNDTAIEEAHPDDQP